eukprot:gene13868-9914_t
MKLDLSDLWQDEDVLFVVLQRVTIFIWILAIVQFYAMELAPCSVVNALTMHGKLSAFISGREGVSFLMVPKHWFTFFYLVGFVIAAGMTVFFINVYSATATLQTIFATILFALHCWRRYLECLYITVYGDSKIHVAFWIGGMVHYFAVNATFWAAALEENQRHVGSSKATTIALAFVLYGAASWLQYHSHFILYQLKLSMDKKKENYTSSSSSSEVALVRYPLPKGGGFDFCVCPHYLAEVGIYLSFAVLTNWSISTWLLVLWVACNLSYTASQHYTYYLTHHFDELERRRLWILLPGVW